MQLDPPVTHRKSWLGCRRAGAAGDAALRARAGPFQMRSFLVHHLSSSRRKEHERSQLRRKRNIRAWEKAERWHQRRVVQGEVTEQGSNPG